MTSGATAAPDFAKAKQLINDLKPNLNYKEICLGKMPSGQMKSAWRLKAVPSVAFLVCKEYYDGYCSEEINVEITNLQKLRASGVSTVPIDNEAISGVKCAQTSDLHCAGFLEEWIDEKVGWLHRLDSYFKHSTVPALIKEIREKIPSPEGLKKTGEDFRKMRDFMTAPQGQYHLICDLQGSFLFDGGFLVNDPQEVKENMGLDQRCDIEQRREPTTRQVIDGLTQLIDNLLGGGCEKWRPPRAVLSSINQLYYVGCE